jgi:Ion channel
MDTAILGGLEPANEGGDPDDPATDTLESQVNISIFLGALILMVFVMPSIGFGEAHEFWYGNIVFTLLLFLGITIARRRRVIFVVSTIIGIAAICIRWVALWMPGRSWQLGSEGATVLAILMIAWILLLRIFRRTGPITAVSIQAAIAIYLLFGLIWANAYLIAMQLDPKSFQSTVSLSMSRVTEWYYYSYVTLTTLGYGEITPVTQVARALAVGEALTGQLYLAVLIARLIGMEITSSQQKQIRIPDNS